MAELVRQWVIVNQFRDEEGKIQCRSTFGPYVSKQEAEEANWTENNFPYPQLNTIVPLHRPLPSS
jgi:hypothetical protein